MTQTKLQAALTSPAFWTIVGLFVYNLLAYFVPMLNGNVQVVANAVLGILFMYLHPSEVQTAKTQ